jgi:hypothetical protein
MTSRTGSSTDHRGGGFMRSLGTGTLNASATVFRPTLYRWANVRPDSPGSPAVTADPLKDPFTRSIHTGLLMGP